MTTTRRPRDYILFTSLLLAFISFTISLSNFILHEGKTNNIRPEKIKISIVTKAKNLFKKGDVVNNKTNQDVEKSEIEQRTQIIDKKTLTIIVGILSLASVALAILYYVITVGESHLIMTTFSFILAFIALSIQIPFLFLILLCLTALIGYMSS